MTGLAIALIRPMSSRSGWRGSIGSLRVPRRHAARIRWRSSPNANARCSDAPYLDVVPLPDCGYRIYYQARLPDEATSFEPSDQPLDDWGLCKLLRRSKHVWREQPCA